MVLSIIVLLSCFMLAYVELETVYGLESFLEDRRAAGGDVYVVEPRSGELDATDCLVLSTRDHIIHSGAVGTPRFVELFTAPGVLNPYLVATLGALRIWSPDLNEHLREGFVVGFAAAQRLGIARGSLIAGPTVSSAPTSEVISTRGSFSAVNGWIVEPATPPGVRECWVEFTQQGVGAGSSSLSAEFFPVEVVVRPAVPRSQFDLDPGSEFISRPQKNGWLLLGTLVAMVLGFVSWARRGESSLYRTLGTDRVELWLLGTVQILVIVIPAGVGGLLWSVVAFALDTEGLPTTAAISVAAWSMTALVLVVVLTAPWLSFSARRSLLLRALKGD